MKENEHQVYCLNDCSSRIAIPGWVLRNYLSRKKSEQKFTKDVTVISIRHNLDVISSRVWFIRGEIHPPSTPVKHVGWISSSVRLVNMSKHLDPNKLA